MFSRIAFLKILLCQEFRWAAELFLNLLTNVKNLAMIKEILNI